MINHNMRLYAESLRTMLVQGYAYNSEAWGDGFAARCAWVIGEVVADIRGRPIAVALLDATSDAINANVETSPSVEMPATLLGVDGRALPGRWIVPAPKTIDELHNLYGLLADVFHNGQDMAKAAASTAPTSGSTS